MLFNFFHLPLSRNIYMTAITTPKMDEQRIIRLLKSDKQSEQEKGFAMLIAQKTICCVIKISIISTIKT